MGLSLEASMRDENSCYWEIAMNNPNNKEFLAESTAAIIGRSILAMWKLTQ
jgi:hypothetical protein